MSISAGELTNYKLQLRQVEEAIKLDPENQELVTLANGLKEVISVAEELASLTAKPAPSTATAEDQLPNQFRENQICEAYYAADGKWEDWKIL